MLEGGNHAAARTSAEHAQEARPDDPDATLLLGAVALAQGNPEESLRCYDRAIELDAEYLEPYTAAAQVCLFDLEDPHRGLRYCADALEIDSLGPFDKLEIHLVAAECELASQSEADARRRLTTLEPEAVLMAALRLGARPELRAELSSNPDSDDALAWAQLSLDADGDELDEDERLDRLGRALALAYRIARMRLDLGEAELVGPILVDLVDWYPSEPDAWYLLSETHHRGGRLPEACVAAVKTLELDHDVELPDWVPSFSVVHRRTVDLMAHAPEPALSALVDTGRPVTVMVRDAPAPELVMEGIDPRAPVLALAGRPAAIALPPGAEPPPPQLTGVAVYRRNLARFSSDADRFAQELRYAVFEELAAFVGLDNDGRQRLGLQPLPDRPPETPPPEKDDGGETPKKRGRRRRSRAAS